MDCDCRYITQKQDGGLVTLENMHQIEIERESLYRSKFLTRNLPVHSLFVYVSLHFHIYLHICFASFSDFSRQLVRKMADFTLCLVPRLLPKHKSLATKLLSICFTRFSFLCALKSWCRNWTNRLPLVWDMVYSLETEGVASLISLSKEINHLKVHSNCNVSVLKMKLFIHYWNHTQTSTFLL